MKNDNHQSLYYKREDKYYKNESSNLEPKEVTEEEYLRPTVHVFFTRNSTIRANIREDKGSIPYETTIGGRNWKDYNKGSKFASKIRGKVERMIHNLNKEKQTHLPDIEITPKFLTDVLGMEPVLNNSWRIRSSWFDVVYVVSGTRGLDKSGWYLATEMWDRKITGVYDLVNLIEVLTGIDYFDRIRDL